MMTDQKWTSFYVKEMVDTNGGSTNLHFQRIILGVESTMRKVIKKYGYKGNTFYVFLRRKNNDGLLLDGCHEVWWIKNTEHKANQTDNKRKWKIENVLDTCY